MDIGPVRRRLVAEPISSPVPGTRAGVDEPAGPPPIPQPVADERRTDPAEYLAAPATH